MDRHLGAGRSEDRAPARIGHHKARNGDAGPPASIFDGRFDEAESVAIAKPLIECAFNTLPERVERNGALGKAPDESASADGADDANPHHDDDPGPAGAHHRPASGLLQTNAVRAPPRPKATAKPGQRRLARLLMRMLDQRVWNLPARIAKGRRDSAKYSFL